MTFTEIVTDVCERANLTSTDAIARVGRQVNRRYRRLRTSIGLTDVARTIVAFSATALSRDQTITAEKVYSVKLSGATKPLEALSYAEMLEVVPTTGAPTRWALKRQDTSTVVLQFDSTMDAGQDMFIECEQTGITLSGSDEPEFNESFHDVLVFGALADELRKKEKINLARDAENEYERILGELRYHIAVNGYKDLVSGSRGTTSTGTGSGGSSGGSGTVTHTGGGLTLNRVVLGAGGGDIKVGLTDITTDDVTSTQHGLAPKSPGDATKFLHGAATPGYAQVKDSDLSTSDITTNNVSTTKHGFVPKAPNQLTRFLRGDADWSVSGQIPFPATQNPSADANTLDDYEEGSWTPVIGGSGGTSGQTYTGQSGNYTKIGNLVTAWFGVTLSAKGVITTNVQIQGLPFAAGAQSGDVTIGYFENLATNWISLNGLLNPAATAATIYGRQTAGTTSVALATADIANNTALIGCVRYRI